MDDILLFCPFDGQKIIVENGETICPIHGRFEEITETWQSNTNVIAYEIRGDILRFDAEKTIRNMMSFHVSDDDMTVKAPPANEITKPSHYNQYTGFEVMDVCRQLVSPDAVPASTWFRGNVFKYLARAGWKPGDGKELQDLEKAGEYLRKEIERVKTRDENSSKSLKEELFDEAVAAVTIKDCGVKGCVINHFEGN